MQSPWNFSHMLLQNYSNKLIRVPLNSTKLLRNCFSVFLSSFFVFIAVSVIISKPQFAPFLKIFILWKFVTHVTMWLFFRHTMSAKYRRKKPTNWIGPIPSLRKHFHCTKAFVTFCKREISLQMSSCCVLYQEN